MIAGWCLSYLSKYSTKNHIQSTQTEGNKNCYTGVIIILSFIFFFIGLRFAITLLNFISNPKLTRTRKRYHDKVSILIPARNEENNILSLLESINKQDYTEYEVIVLDDDSTDRTRQICSEFAALHPNFRVIEGKPLPENWLGKNYACFQLAGNATGKYLLFLDADERIASGLINSGIHRMNARKLSLLSLFTTQEMITTGEKTVVPLMYYLLLNLLPIRLIYRAKNPAFGVASGQFMLFDAVTYKLHQWHKTVCNKVVEDVEIMKLVKAAGCKGESLMANGLISCRMYSGYYEAVNGFSKNFLAVFNYRIPLFIVYLLSLIGGPLIIIATLNLPLIIIMCSLIILTRFMISDLSGQSLTYNTLLHPLQMVSLVVIGIVAIYKHLTNTLRWKGRDV